MNGVAELVDRLRAVIADERVLAAIAAVPRELFVLPEDRERAYANVALSIDCGQTVSQPLVVARMCELLELQAADAVLDVGTGSGYHAAVLAQLVGHVDSIEHLPELSATAADNLAAAGIHNVTLHLGDGRQGLPSEAPFDAINIAAAAPGRIPEALERQLADSGRLVAPVQSRLGQRLMLVRRSGEELRRTRLEPVRFVALH